MKYRTINEAVQLVIPDLPADFVQAYADLEKVVRADNASAVSKVHKIYGLADRIGAFLASYMVCEKGCSHCCYIDVQVSLPEAQYIQKNLGIAPDSGVTHTTGFTGQGMPCGFLGQDGCCSIYAHRPFMCRSFFTVDDPKYCADNSRHATYTAGSNGLLNKLFLLLVHLNQGRPVRDVRDYFPRSPGQ